MIGFKKVPVKSVLIAFLLSIFLIMLLYADFITDDSLPEERIEITESSVSYTHLTLPTIYSV